MTIPTPTPTTYFQAAQNLYKQGLDYAEKTTKNYTGSDRCATAARYLATPLALAALAVGTSYALKTSVSSGKDTVQGPALQKVLSSIKAQISSGSFSDKTYDLGSFDKVRIIANKSFARAGAAPRIARNAIAVISQGTSASTFINEMISPLLKGRKVSSSHSNAVNELINAASITANSFQKV
jgi:hypothetical protein